MTTTTTTLRCPHAAADSATVAGSTPGDIVHALSDLLQGGSVPWVARRVLKALENLQHGQLRLRTPTGHLVEFKGQHEGLTAELQINDWAVLGLIARKADIGLAEAYADQRCNSPDWVALLRLAQHNQQALENLFDGSWIGKLGCLVRHWLNRNSRNGSRRNIHAHYDLGNPFYKLWLDPTMTYSSALFKGDYSLGLASAQVHKYRNILDWLNPAPGASILEIGCGWGGFAELAAQARCQVTGLTLSTEQLAWAQQRLEAQGMANRARFLLQDYRDHAERHDHIVSIEMFEAVGEQYWPTYFNQVAHCLKPGGTAVIQTITIGDAWFENYRRSTDFIQQYIFPGGMLPSPRRFREEAERAGLRVEKTLDFGFDYAETLRRWRETFEQSLPAIRTQGFDERFIRLWRFYLVYCEAGFLEGRISVQQTLVRLPA